ncbi:UDP-galactopyranose mutase [Musicola paradisiaca Ech703]|uniref:UDP-galactopyranose mutase n=2 Tax=Musicola paradisiaca TaxID=69223 RepID=C6C3L0_MUSP7|nr:UDP-galactopyranose mutase [Musicola paradisiaca Ech703]
MKKIAVVGAGFSGAVLARELALAGYDVSVFDSRNHVAGNCYTARDKQTGIMVHKYGPHIFHTSDERVWKYINQFDKINNFTNRVKAISNGHIYSLPINLMTINSFFGKVFSPHEAKNFVSSIAENAINIPVTFEEQALKFVGKDLYEAFFKGYTQKQWGVHPSELPASILKRLPVRFNYDDNYYNSNYQGIPENGYTVIVEKILTHKNIHLILNTHFFREMASEYEHVFYSGPIDAWFNHLKGKLGYRTLDFKPEYHHGDYQGNAVINYCDINVPWTRISEHKNFAPWESYDSTLIYKEYSRECMNDDVPYYPIRLVKDKNILFDYIELANKEKNITFIGRLGTYRYLDMHVTISEALDTAAMYLRKRNSGENIPAFFVQPLN